MRPVARDRRGDALRPPHPRTPATSTRPGAGSAFTRAATSRTRIATTPSGGSSGGSGSSSSTGGAGRASASAVRPVCSCRVEVSDGELGIGAGPGS